VSIPLAVTNLGRGGTVSVGASATPGLLLMKAWSVDGEQASVALKPREAWRIAANLLAAVDKMLWERDFGEEAAREQQSQGQPT